MLATLAALSIVAALTIDVPYLPQTEDLCGGAAAAMVFRYWGDAHADAQGFASLVDHRAGGIGNQALIREIAARGWRTARTDGSLDALRARLRDGLPVIVLLPDRGDRYHYVVVIGASAEAIVVHDPAWGPSRTIRAPDFERAWKRAGFWSLVILPPALAGTREEVRLDPTPVANACDARLNRALDEIAESGLDKADALLAGVRAECPLAAGPIRELSGVRFAQRRWNDAVVLARDALRREPGDAYALDVLGSSLFMLGDDIGALRAWNQIGKPRVNRVRIDGLHHTRYQTMTEVMAIQPNMLLTAERFDRARRRLADLPDHALTRLAVKPEADGFATVDVVVIEPSPIPRGAVEWAGAAAGTLANREISISMPGVSGRGDVWSASWRWWSHRPGVSVGFAVPGTGRLRGVWRFEGAWQSDTYGGAQGSTIIESWTHGGLSVGDWLPGGFRYTVSTGLDSWSGGRKAASIGAGLERAAFGDRLSLSIAATQWAPFEAGSAFRSIGARAVGRSSSEARGWITRGSVGVERVSDAAPLALWPSAGKGAASTPLLRAHPLLNDGVVELTTSSAFGRTLAFGSAELQRWLERPALVRLGLAVFADAARAARQTGDGRTTAQVDLGAGLRVRIPGVAGVLRADVAHGLRDGANALTFGWLF